MLQSKNNKMHRVMVMAVLSSIGLFFLSASFAAAQFGPTRATAVVWPNGKTFFFRGGEFISYDNATDRMDAGYPRPIAGNWPGLWADNLDAVFVWPNGKAYFFKGSQYIRWDLNSARADSGYPKTIASGWPGVWADHIDAAVSWPNGKTYFFRGTEFISYDTKADRSDPGYPRSIASSWPAILRDGIDAATVYPSGKALFYKAGSYLSYDIATARVEPPKTFQLWEAGRGAQATAPPPYQQTNPPPYQPPPSSQTTYPPPNQPPPTQPTYQPPPTQPTYQPPPSAQTTYPPPYQPPPTQPTYQPPPTQPTYQPPPSAQTTYPPPYQPPPTSQTTYPQPPPTQPTYQQPTAAQPQKFIPNMVGTLWAFTVEGQEYRFDFDQSTVKGWGFTWAEINPNQVRVFDAETQRAMVMNFDSPTSFRGISWDGTTAISGTRILDPLYLSGMAKVIGTYQRYAGVQNDWHVGTITQDGAGYRWTNKAGRSWYLTPDVKTQTLYTSRENPYYQDGNSEAQRDTRQFTLSRGNGCYTGFNFMGDYYKLQ